MIKNFTEELELMNSNNCINEKLMVFSLYNEFYNDILAHIDDNNINYYAPLMEKSFDLVVAGLNLQHNINVNAKQFMNLYLEVLNKSRFSSMPQTKGIIKTYKNELNSFIEANEYVNVIDKFNTISLDTKVNVMAQFREYINNMFITTINLYGEENSKDLRFSILDMQSTKLEEYLKDSIEKGNNENDIINNLKSTMAINTKDYLKNKLRNGDNSLKNFEDESFKQFFNDFNEIEQKIWLMGTIYGIANYNQAKDKEKIEEICELVGISKLQYTKTALSIGIRSVKMMKKNYNEINSETNDSDLSTKRKRQ